MEQPIISGSNAFLYKLIIVLLGLLFSVCGVVFSQSVSSTQEKLTGLKEAIASINERQIRGTERLSQLEARTDDLKNMNSEIIKSLREVRETINNNWKQRNK